VKLTRIVDRLCAFIQQSMKWYSFLWRLLLLTGLAGIAWLAWQPPLPALQPPIVRASLPATPVADRTVADRTVGDSTVADNSADALSGPAEKPGQAATPLLWRVVTRRMITPEGIHALTNRLEAMHTHPISIHTTEEMTMHAFDDAQLFKSRRQAREMARFWQQHDIETNIIRAAKGVYLLGLGRYFQAKYAEAWQQQLDRVGRKYRYQRRRVPVPVVRFTFPSGDRQQSERLWKKLNTTGIVIPVLISESQFDKLYGDKIQLPQ